MMHIEEDPYSASYPPSLYTPEEPEPSPEPEPEVPDE